MGGEGEGPDFVDVLFGFFLATRQLTASKESEMLVDNLAKVPDIFVFPSDTRNEKKSAWLSLSGPPWLNSRVLFGGKRNGPFPTVHNDPLCKGYSVFEKERDRQTGREIHTDRQRQRERMDENV